MSELPGKTSYHLTVSRPGGDWSVSLRPDERMVVASAIKTFILAKALKDVEAGRLDENAQAAVDDGVRSLSSPVFLKLTGTAPVRSALEAMIAHSDNTGTDIALKLVGPERVRSFIASAGLESVLIPTSTRRLFSYLAGAPYGVDEGWDGMLRIEAGETFGKQRSPLNERETMQGTARDFVTYYRRVLKGGFFRDDATLVEFKRISAMADALPYVVPPDTPAYGKGGSIEWGDFRCFSLAGQMILAGTTPVTFCFAVNWDAPPEAGAVQQKFIEVISAALAATAKVFG
ncbi:MAG: serine hydrolase [Hansschlegelia sp.]